MKKLISMLLALVMAFALTACSTAAPAETQMPTEAPATEAAKPELTGTMEELLNRVVEVQPVEFAGMVNVLDLTNTSEVNYSTGLENADQITEAAEYMPMMGSIAYSMVMVRVNEDADAKTVAEAMKSGIDTRKWICVEADDLLVCGYGDVVMLIMVDSNTGLTAQSFVDAFQTVCGAELDFVI